MKTLQRVLCSKEPHSEKGRANQAHNTSDAKRRGQGKTASSVGCGGADGGAGSGGCRGRTRRMSGGGGGSRSSSRAARTWGSGWGSKSRICGAATLLYDSVHAAGAASRLDGDDVRERGQSSAVLQADGTVGHGQFY
jgi:hypothetical protein